MEMYNQAQKRLEWATVNPPQEMRFAGLCDEEDR
jgi:hypothetical protein